MTEKRKVLVTGATGKVGRHVVAGLLEQNAEVTALVRNPQTADLPDVVRTERGDLQLPETVARAATGADAAFLLWPAFSTDGAAEAVKALGDEVSHIVYLSAALLQGVDDGVMAGVFADVEALIDKADVTRTFVRSGGFAANTLEWADQIRAGGEVAIAHPDASRSLVHERDLADVVVRALLDDAHVGAAYAVTGPEVTTQREQVAAIGRAIGRSPLVVDQPAEQALAQLEAIGGADFAERSLAHWATLVDRPERATDDVQRVTGHSARSFDEWARDHAQDFGAPSVAEVAPV